MSARIRLIVAAFAVAASLTYMASQSLPVAPAGVKVNVPFFANDAHDKPVPDVTLADVTILDDKEPPQSALGIRPATELPLRLGVLIGTNGSQSRSGIYRVEVEAASEFLTKVLNGTDDKAFVEKFGFPSATEFLTKEDLRTVKLDVVPYGPSVLYDAIDFACDERMKKDPLQLSRRVLVLVVDGHDNASHADKSKAIASAQEAGAVMFIVSSFDRTGLGDDDLLKEFADQTGGIAFLQLSGKDIPGVFATVKEQIDNMRVLSYVPAGSLRSGQRRSFKLKAASNRKLKLRAPKAFYLNVAAP